MTTIHQLAQQYRRLCAQVSSADLDIQTAKKRLEESEKSRNRIIKDMDELRVLMDYCIISGDSPEQAKLTYSLTEMETKILEHRSQHRTNDFYYVDHGQSAAIRSTFSVGIPNNTTAIVSTVSAPLVTSSVLQSMRMGTDHDWDIDAV